MSFVLKNQRRGIFDLVLGAIMLGIFITLYLLVPGGNSAVQSAMIVATCLPLALYTLSCGIKKAAVVVFVGAALSVLFLQPVVLLSYAIPALVIGILSGLAISKCKKITAIVMMAALHLAQNCFEIYLAYALMGIRVSETYAAVINKTIELVSIYFTSDALLLFLRDFLMCCVPAVLVLGAMAKGVITDYIIDYLMRSKYFKFKRKEETKGELPALFSAKTITWVYLGELLVQLVVTAVFLLGVAPYHFVFPAMTAFTMVCAFAYLYYYHLTNIKAAPLTQNEKMMRSAALLLLLPITMFAAPVHVLLKMKKSLPNDEKA